MSSGSPPKQWYADWVAVLEAVHAATDHLLPDIAKREKACSTDLWALHLDGVHGWCPTPTEEWALALDGDEAWGAVYVTVGAHLFGGEIMRRRLEGYPTAHLQWKDRPAVLEWFKPLRQREELAEPARACFAELLKAMDFIQGRTTSPERTPQP
jgi:hypothetical protein